MTIRRRETVDEHARTIFLFFSFFLSFFGENYSIWNNIYIYVCVFWAEIKYRELVYLVDACRKLGIGDLRRMANGE